MVCQSLSLLLRFPQPNGLSPTSGLHAAAPILEATTAGHNRLEIVIKANSSNPSCGLHRSGYATIANPTAPKSQPRTRNVFIYSLAVATHTRRERTDGSVTD